MYWGTNDSLVVTSSHKYLISDSCYARKDRYSILVLQTLMNLKCNNTLLEW